MDRCDRCLQFDCRGCTTPYFTPAQAYDRGYLDRDVELKDRVAAILFHYGISMTHVRLRAELYAESESRLGRIIGRYACALIELVEGESGD